MGDHALCLIDAGKLDEAKNRLDQLGAITPRDWRVALGRAVLAETAGDMETAKAGFESAALAAPNSVRFENADHDFPQRIFYRQPKKGELAATISRLDGSRPVNYAWVECGKARPPVVIK